MQVFFKSHGAQAADLLELSQRRTRFVLRRLDWLVPQATVRISDVNGPRGGIDKRCQVELKTEVAGTAVATSVANNWRSALDDALARAARLVLRLVKRDVDSRRLRQRAIKSELTNAHHSSAPHPATPTRIMSDS